MVADGERGEKRPRSPTESPPASRRRVEDGSELERCKRRIAELEDEVSALRQHLNWGAQLKETFEAVAVEHVAASRQFIVESIAATSKAQRVQFSVHQQDAPSEGETPAETAAEAPAKLASALEELQRRYSEALIREEDQRKAAELARLEAEVQQEKAKCADDLRKQLADLKVDQSRVRQAALLRDSLEKSVSRTASLSVSADRSWSEWSALMTKLGLAAPDRVSNEACPADVCETILKHVDAKVEAFEVRVREADSALQRCTATLVKVQQEHTSTKLSHEDILGACEQKDKAHETTLLELARCQGELETADALLRALIDSAKGVQKGLQFQKHFDQLRRYLEKARSDREEVNTLQQQVRQECAKSIQNIKSIYKKAKTHMIESTRPFEKQVLEQQQRAVQELTAAHKELHKVSEDQFEEGCKHALGMAADTTGWALAREEGGVLAKLVGGSTAVLLSNDGRLHQKAGTVCADVLKAPGAQCFKLARIVLASEAKLPSLCLMRHGVRADTAGEEWEEKGSRPYDPPLATEGDALAGACAALKAQLGNTPVSAVVCSPYRRCLETAGVICRELGLAEVVVEEGLQECVLALRRITNDTVTFLSAADAEQAVGSGISVLWPDRTGIATDDQDTVRRVSRVIPMLWERHRTASGAAVVMVTHGDVINSYLPTLEGVDDVGAFTAKEGGWALMKGEGAAAPARARRADVVATHEVYEM